MKTTATLLAATLTLVIAACDDPNDKPKARYQPVPAPAGCLQTECDADYDACPHPTCIDRCDQCIDDCRGLDDEIECLDDICGDICTTPQPPCEDRCADDLYDCRATQRNAVCADD